MTGSTQSSAGSSPRSSPAYSKHGHAPADPSESAIVVNLSPGNYTAIVRGMNNTTGAALVEVYDLNPFRLILGNISTRSLVQTGDDVMIGGSSLKGLKQRT